MTDKEEIERLRRKLEMIHEIAQETGVPQWQLLDNIAATAASALRLSGSYIDDEMPTGPAGDAGQTGWLGGEFDR